MQTNEFLNKVCEQIKYKPIRNEISQELENHIEELKESYIQEGIKEDEAEQKAIIQMGEAEEIGKKLNKIHKPKMNLLLLILVLILIAFGFLLSSHIDSIDDLKLNLLCIALSIIPFLIIYFFDYKKLQNHSDIIYGIATIILLMPIIAEDKTWAIRSVIGTIAMTLYIIAFVGFIENMKKDNKLKIEYFNRHINISIIKMTILLATISLIILLQYSRSLMWILLLTYYTIITSKVIQTKQSKNIWKLLNVTTISVIITILIWLGSLLPYNEIYGITRKIAIKFNPEIDPIVAWETMMQRDAIKSAKLLGKTDDVDTKTVLFYNAEKEAFPLIAMLINYGWIISILMIIAVVLFSIKLIIDANKIKDTYGKLLVIGIAGLFIFRSIVCIIVNLNVGLLSIHASIPFVSCSKANLLVDILSLAVIFSVYRRKNIILDLSQQNIMNEKAN